MFSLEFVREKAKKPCVYVLNADGGSLVRGRGYLWGKEKNNATTLWVMPPHLGYFLDAKVRKADPEATQRIQRYHAKS